MPPHPLTSRSSPVGIQFGPGCLEHRPQAAALVAQIIAYWTEVEFNTAMLLAAMLNATAEPTIAMYLSLANARAKRDATDAVADFIFSDEQRRLYDAAMTAKTSLEKERIAFAHGLFGLKIDDPTGIIVVKTSERAKSVLRFENKLFAGELSASEVLPGLARMASSWRHYKINDLTNILNDIEAVNRIITNMKAYVSFIVKHESHNEEIYQIILKEPLIMRFISQESASPKSG